ncbi:uncharacterized protein LOC125549167 [Triticum urartu]|uniref:KIB1-4 beta-propeller domain-containing protein n=1 Tax=Triticum turgidum subsp. durum TaxID=4567 RepID=A0A9R0RYV2_TRITD|nr:uncharacterized protein LOC123059233 [Triticum aestivum]XP_048568598.1 uncharacterized protein LOC125549167 [Triticum urartu]XP_048568599.1 uncharacterized protein LOC125549167 [Triticum urartu]VAH68643.1 unnamed protein product [Triticum turgidum subsp. durum]
MAAAAAEVLLPSKRQKNNPSCLGTLPVLPVTATADWSSLQPDIVRHIANSFLTTDDVDCYMDLRAVCHNWRCATDDPKDDTSDPRFLPYRWIILNDAFQSGTRRLLVNTNTGRFLHRELPLLRDYYVITTTLTGFFILADRSPPHAARVFNPLTGGTIPFTVPVPPEVNVAGSICFDFTLPLLTLLSDSSHKLYMTRPDQFEVEDHKFPVYSFIRRAVVGGLIGRWWGSAGMSDVIGKILGVAESLHAHPLKFFSADPPEMGSADNARCFLMDFGGHMLAIIKGQGLIQVFKCDDENGTLSHVKSIINHAIFIGHHRCLAVNTDMFPSIEANCIYYTEHLGSSARIWKFNIEDREVETVSEAVDFAKKDKQFVLVADRPFTIIQLLSSYTINIQDSELALQQIT